MKIIHKLHEILNMIKGCKAGYSTTNGKEMLVSVNGETYKLTIEKVENEELTIDMVNKYL